MSCDIKKVIALSEAERECSTIADLPGKASSIRAFAFTKSMIHAWVNMLPVVVAKMERTESRILLDICGVTIKGSFDMCILLASQEDAHGYG
jgi:hypothetical protein